MEAKGGLVTLADMRDYRAVVREPVVGSYRDYTVFGMPPPSSGGVHVIQILNLLEISRILEGRAGWDSHSVLWTSRFMSRAFEDRAAYLGDSDFTPVPVERLTSRAYAEEIVTDLMKREEAPAALSGSDGAVRPEGGHTTSFIVLDRAGNVVAVNQTVNLNYGAKITLPGTGVILNNEMDDFSAQPGTPNAFGLVGSEANAIEAGKRPLSSMSPTIVVKDAEARHGPRRCGRAGHHHGRAPGDGERARSWHGTAPSHVPPTVSPSVSSGYVDRGAGHLPRP